MKSVCIVTPTYISSNPRVVKEADALLSSGLDVRVVFSQGNLEMAREFDNALLKDKPWRTGIVGWSPFKKEEKPLYWRSGLRQSFARTFPSIFNSFGTLAEYAEGRVYSELAELAASERADIYIGHYPIGLACASYAALRWKTVFGYDAEDLHTEESYSGKKDMRKIKRIGVIESRYLASSSHVTAVSESICAEIAKRYKIALPLAVHNTFPLSERDSLDGMIKDRRGARLSLYWYSQVIGEDRGIQDAIRASGLLKDKVELHLRGYISEETKHKLLSLAGQYGVKEKLYIHPPVPTAELLSRAAEHDVGLALEQPVSLNRMLTATNKIFFYLLAGLAIAATDTVGQKRVISSCPGAGFIYRPGDYRKLADNLHGLVTDEARLRSCKAASLEAARKRWNWEKESEGLVKSILNLLNG